MGEDKVYHHRDILTLKGKRSGVIGGEQGVGAHHKPVMQKGHHERYLYRE